ncbi:MAG TPA: hypothetical protein DEP35_21520 [Deltaproteobacteria bacterium]|nr:hypothetical protein [Deltaproteobacteria bacterium]
MPRATSLAAAIRKRFAIDATLVRGHNGIFDVWVDGERIFSKNETGRFPEEDEILLLIAKRAS